MCPAARECPPVRWLQRCPAIDLEPHVTALDQRIRGLEIQVEDDDAVADAWKPADVGPVPQELAGCRSAVAHGATAVKLGADAALPKPFRPVELLSLISVVTGSTEGDGDTLATFRRKIRRRGEGGRVEQW